LNRNFIAVALEGAGQVALGALHIADFVVADGQVALRTGSGWLRFEQMLHAGLGGLVVAESFVERGVINCVIALGDKEPELCVEGIRPVRLRGENLGEEAGGLGGPVTVSLELGALKQREKIGTVLLASGGGACLYFL